MENGAVNASYPVPVLEEPHEETLIKWFETGVALSTDGCTVELDGICPHGYPSWFLYLNIIA